jgi:hypothetical protein
VVFQSRFCVPIIWSNVGLWNCLQQLKWEWLSLQSTQTYSRLVILNYMILTCISPHFESKALHAMLLFYSLDFYLKSKFTSIHLTWPKFLTSVHLVSFLPLLASVLPVTREQKYSTLTLFMCVCVCVLQQLNEMSVTNRYNRCETGCGLEELRQHVKNLHQNSQSLIHIYSRTTTSQKMW